MVPLNQGQLFAARAMIQAVKVTGEEIATCLRQVYLALLYEKNCWRFQLLTPSVGGD